MKTKFIIGWLMTMCLSSATAQIFNEKITRELEFETKSSSNALMIANINGHVKVQGYEGSKIIVEVEKEIKGKTQARLEKGKSEIQLGLIDLADTLILFVDGTCSKFGKNNQLHRRGDRRARGWNYDWQDCDRDCHEEYEYTMDFTVRVPAGIHINLSTINEGDIEVSNVGGAVSVYNINGSIKLTRLAGPTDASTINGDVDLEYVKNPASDCRYYSLNGDINAYFQKGLGASVSFESFNGDFYTNVPSIETLPVELEKKQKGDGVKYKVNGNRFKVGSGGVKLDFETFNGNVYLKEI